MSFLRANYRRHTRFATNFVDPTPINVEAIWVLRSLDLGERVQVARTNAFALLSRLRRLGGEGARGRRDTTIGAPIQTTHEQ